MPIIKGLRKRSVAAPIFDPAILSLNGWWKAYPGAPWAGATSAGNSSTYSATAGVAPAVGSLDGKGVANWTASSSQVLNTTPASNLITTTGFTATLLRATSTSATDANPAYQTCVWSDGNPSGSYIGAGLTTTEAFFYMYGSSYISVKFPIASPLNTWMVLFTWWDGTNMYIQINNGTPVQLPGTLNTGGMGSNTMVLGRNTLFANTKYWNGSTAEFMFSKTNLSSSIVNLYSYFKGAYPSAGLP